MRSFSFFCELSGYRTFLAFTISSHRVCVGLHCHQVHHPGEIALTPDRQKHGHHLASEGIAQRFERPLSIGAIAIHAIHHDDARHLHLGSVIPDAARHGLNSAHTIDHHQRSFSRNQCGLGFMQKHVETGSVDQIDLALIPLAIRRRAGDGHLTSDLFIIPGSWRGAIVYAAEPLGCPCGI